MAPKWPKMAKNACFLVENGPWELSPDVPGRENTRKPSRKVARTAWRRYGRAHGCSYHLKFTIYAFLGHFRWFLCQKRWFFTIKLDLKRAWFSGSIWGPCTGAQKSKKIKIARNHLKHIQTIIECHIEGFRGRPITLGYHMSLPIFHDFGGILEVFGQPLAHCGVPAKVPPENDQKIENRL